MNNPKISVIVPVYNNQEYLPSTIESLLRQSYRNIEIILVDDGSQDGSGKICDEFAEKYDNITAIHQSNKGVSVARNAGMKIATGSLIGFCDGDDTVDEDFYEFLYKQMEQNNSDISGCVCNIITEDNSYSNKTTNSVKIWENNQEYLRDLLSGYLSMSTCTKLFKKEILTDVQYPEGFKTNEDKYFCFLAALNAKRISFQDTGKYHYYRRLGSSSMTEFNEKFFGAIELAEKIISIINEKKPELHQEAECNKLITVMMVYNLLYVRNGLPKFAEKERELRAYIKKFDDKTAKKLLGKNDYIRFRIIRLSSIAYKLFVKLTNKN